MNSFSRRHAASHASRLLLASLGVLACTGALALDKGTGPAGQPFMMGGVGQDETQQMEAARGSYSLKVLTAAPSGDFLANVQTRITAGGKVFFDQKLNGPVLLINLPPGHYEVNASFRGQQQAKAVDIAAGKPAGLDFRFQPAND